MKKIPICILFNLFLIVGQSQPGLADVSGIKNKWLDIPYASVSSAQKLDIYIPESGEGPFPVIVSIHGGAFMFGDKRDNQVYPMLEGLKKGYAVVSVNYRLSGEAIFPKNIQDVKAAIRWIRAHAKQYHLNPERIAAWGGSAGGNLSALAGTSGGIPELEDLTLGNTEQSSRVQVVVDWFGPTNFLLMDAQLKETGNGVPDHDEANSPESRLMGKKITEIPEQVKWANPETFITSDDPPFLIEHGTKDQIVPTQQSVQFAEKLESVLGKEKVKIYLLEGVKHAGPEFNTKANLDIVFAFLDKYLK
jgi:acetyl esterase/lipase